MEGGGEKGAKSRPNDPKLGVKRVPRPPANSVAHIAVGLDPISGKNVEKHLAALEPQLRGSVLVFVFYLVFLAFFQYLKIS